MGRGRIPRACLLCRKNKTKCHISEGMSSCDKCQSLQADCSFVKGTATADKQNSPAVSTPTTPAGANGIVSDPGSTGTPPAGPALVSRIGKVEEQLENILKVVHKQREIIDRYEGTPPPGAQTGPAASTAQTTPAPVQAHTPGPTAVRRRMEDPSPQGPQPKKAASSGAPSPDWEVNSTRTSGSDHSAQSGTPRTAPPASVTPQEPAIEDANHVGASTFIANMQVVDVTKNPALQHAGYQQRYAPHSPHDLSRDPSALANPAARSGIGNLGFPYQNSLAFFVSNVVSPAYGYGQHFVGPARPANPHDNIVSKGILSRMQIVELVGYFRDNYNHWVLFDQEMSDEDLTDELLRRSNLLVLTCCCISLRFGKPSLRASVFPYFVKYLASELHFAAAHVPQTIDFLRSVTLIATFGDSLSCHEILFDIWSVSSMGIEHFNRLLVADPDDSILLLRLWNHLTLSHLTACNTSGRHCLIDGPGIAVTHNITHYARASHFDLCMVAEISLHYLTYRYSTYELSYADVQHQIQQWQNTWSFILSQPAIQFVGALHNYLEFNIQLQEAVRGANLSTVESIATIVTNEPGSYTASATYLASIYKDYDNMTLVMQMEGLDKSIKSLLEVVPQEFFAFLSDGLHRMGFVASVMVIRISYLLYKREINAEVEHAIGRVLHSVRQLADRFQVTSGSHGDMSNSFALSIYDLLHRYHL